METIGKIIATEKQPSTIEDFTFWTKKDLKLKPFDVVAVEHIQNSKTFGVVEEISHMTDSPSALAGYIGMISATKSNCRVANAAKDKGMSAALKVAFNGGSVLGLSVVGLSLFGLAAIFMIFVYD